MLAIFAAHAQSASEGPVLAAPGATEAKNLAFAEYIVPFYARCLIEVRPTYPRRLAD